MINNAILQGRMLKMDQLNHQYVENHTSHNYAHGFSRFYHLDPQTTTFCTLKITYIVITFKIMGVVCCTHSVYGSNIQN